MNFTESLYFSSTALNRLLSSMADEAFRELGFTSSYAFLLMLVHEQPGVQPTELSRKLQLKPSTITRLVEKMEYRGFAERRSKGRATHIELTDEGRGIQPRLQRAWDALQNHYSEILGERYVRVLSEMTFKASEQLKGADKK
jgi:DNA-binding MarR family transcriptional regulator